MPGPGQPAGRPGQQQMHRLASSLVGAARIPRAAHDGQGGGPRSRRHLVQVARHQRPYIGVQPSGDAPLILLVFRQDLGGDGGEQAQGQPPGDLSLKPVIDEGEQQIHRDGFRAKLMDLPQQDGDVLLRQGLHHRPVGVQTAPGLQAQRRRDWRGWRLRLQVVQRSARLPAYGQHIAQAAVRHIDDAGPLAFQHRIGRHGGAVNDVQTGQGNGQFPNALQDSRLRRLRGGQDLAHMERFSIKIDKIREGAAGVDSQQSHRSRNPQRIRLPFCRTLPNAVAAQQRITEGSVKKRGARQGNGAFSTLRFSTLALLHVNGFGQDCLSLFEIGDRGLLVQPAVRVESQPGVLP